VQIGAHRTAHVQANQLGHGVIVLALPRPARGAHRRACHGQEFTGRDRIRKGLAQMQQRRARHRVGHRELMVRDRTPGFVPDAPQVWLAFRHEQGVHGEPVEDRGIDLAGQLVPGPAQQGRAEVSPAQQVHVLLALDDVLQRFEPRTRALVEFTAEHVLQVRIAQVLQAVVPRVPDEIGEQRGFVDLLHEIVEHVNRVAPGQPRQFLAQVLCVQTGQSVDTIPENTQQVARAFEPRPRIGEVPDVEQKQVTHHPPHAPARQRVAADERHTRRREQALAQLENALAGPGRHPGIQTVGDDVVELTRVAVEILELGVHDPCIGQARGLDQGLGAHHLFPRALHTHEGCARVVVRQRQQVAPLGATEFQHPGMLRRCGLEPEQPRLHREPPGVCLRHRRRLVRHYVVGIHKLVVHGCFRRRPALGGFCEVRGRS